jgi:hypothetical protein
MCDFQEDVIRELGKKGYQAELLARKYVDVPKFNVRVEVTSWKPRSMIINLLNRQVCRGRVVKYQEPKRGFSVSITVDRIIKYCEEVWKR